jgi:parallel beta-helix repeat protein
VHGIYFQGTDHAAANNVIHDQPLGFGIQVYDSNHRSIIVNNTITESGHSGIVVGGSGGVSDITIRNNVVASNDHWGISFASA